MRIVIEDANENECLAIDRRGLLAIGLAAVVVLCFFRLPCRWETKDCTEWFHSSWDLISGKHPYWQSMRAERGVTEFGSLVDGRRHGLWCRCTNESVSWMRLHYGLPEVALIGLLQQPPMLTADMRRAMGSEFNNTVVDHRRNHGSGSRQFKLVKQTHAETNRRSLAPQDSH